MLVDDDHLVRRGVKRLLEKVGFAVTEAADADAAEQHLQASRSKGPPIVAAMIDIVMPGRSGLQLLEGIRATDKALPVLLYSGYADVKDTWSAELDQRTVFLRKPIEVDRLIEELSSLLSVAPVLSTAPPPPPPQDGV